MGKKIYDINYGSESAYEYDSSFTSAILSSNNAGFFNAFILPVGIVMYAILSDPIHAIGGPMGKLAGLVIEGIGKFILTTRRMVKGLVKGFLHFIGLVGDLFKRLGRFLKYLRDVFKEHGFFKGLGILYDDMFDRFGKWLTDWQMFKYKMIDNFVEGFNKFVESMNDTIKLAKESVVDFLSKTKGLLKGLFDDLIHLRIIKLAKMAFEKTIIVVGGLIEFVAKTIFKIGEAIGVGIANGIKYVFKRIKNFPNAVRKANSIRKVKGDIANRVSKDAKLKSKKFVDEIKSAKNKKEINEIAKEAESYQNMVKEGDKLAKNFDKIGKSSESAGMVAGIAIGTIVDSIELHKEGMEVSNALSIGLVSNVVGGIAGDISMSIGEVVLPILAVALLPFEVPAALIAIGAIAIGILTDVFVSNIIKNKQVDKYNELTSDDGMAKQVSGITLKLWAPIEKAIKNSVFFTARHLVKLLDGTVPIPQIAVLEQIVKIDGVEVTDDDAPTSSTDDSTEPQPINTKDVELKYPGVMLKAYLDSRNSVPTYKSFQKKHNFYLKWLDILNSSITMLNIEKDNLNAEILNQNCNLIKRIRGDC